MGKKRGFHVVRIGRWFKGASGGGTIFVILYKRNKCRHAKIYRAPVLAIDELDAYRKIKQFH